MNSTDCGRNAGGIDGGRMAHPGGWRAADGHLPYKGIDRDARRRRPDGAGGVAIHARIAYPDFAAREWRAVTN